MIDEARLKAIEAAIPPAIEDPGGDILVQENRQLRDDLIHKDAVIKALQQQYVDHMKPLVALREAVDAYVKSEELDDPRITNEGTALYALRHALDACRE